MSTSKQESLAQRAARLESQKKEIVEGLPHLYGFKWYPWARTLLNSLNRMNLLCAANQISKSSTQIRRHVRNATDKKRWPLLYHRRSPKTFWQLYPNKDVSTAEFEDKWVKEFMPRGKYKDHPVYGWQAEYEKKRIYAIHWNSGIKTYWKTYEQDVMALQSGTVDEIFCDEELPVDLYDELKARLYATDGIFNMVFTATRNQELWFRAMEGKGPTEAFPDALKLQISAYDCLRYDDGSPGAFTEEYIRQLERGCKSANEVLRRIHGRFIAEGGRKFPQYDPTRHYISPRPIPLDWKIVTAIDKGGGKKTTKDNHYSAVVLVAVRPDFRLGYIFDGWRGDGVETTSQDVLDKHNELRGHHRPMLQIYPHDAVDFGMIAQRVGEPFIKADKSHDRGEDVVNTLFKNDMLYIFDKPELNKLGSELMTLMKATPKERAKDDIADAMRYAVVGIPWDMTFAVKEKENDAEEARAGEAKKSRVWTEEERAARELAHRRGEAWPGEAEEVDSASDFEDECRYWNGQYGG